MFYCNKF